MADTAVTYGLMCIFLSAAIVRNIYPWACIHGACHCTDMNKTNDRHSNASSQDVLPAGWLQNCYNPNWDIQNVLFFC